MNQMGGQSQFSDEDLRKLAILLQQMPQGEGLASINQDEAQLMKSYGGSGAPLPGTQGLGPGGDLVRSYGEEDDDDDDWGGGSGDTYGGYDSGDSSGTFGGYDSGDSSGTFGGYGDTSGTTGPTKPKPSVIATSPAAPAPPPEPTYSFTWESDPEKSFTENLSDNWNKLDVVTWFKGLPDAKMPPDIRFEKDAAVIQQYYRDNPEKLLGDDGSGEDSVIMQQGGPVAVAAVKAAILKEKTTKDTTKMVETMNNYFANPKVTENTTYDEFKANIQSADAPEVLYVEGDTLPEGAAVGDVRTPAVVGIPSTLSESVLRTMFETARKKYQRGEAFTLTPEEVAAFSRTAIQTAAVSDAEKVTIGEFDEATLTDVGAVEDVAQTEVDAIADVTDADIDDIFAGGITKAEELLMARIDGTADSPAERQLFRTSENNLRMLLGTTAGGDADPAKVRQLKNIWADMTQVAVGDAADLRSKESLAAEAKLVELWMGKNTMELNTKLANLEKDKQVAFKNGDLELAGKLSNQQIVLQRVITKASLDTNTKLANLETAKEKAIAQGKMNLATNIANLQKDITLSTVDARLATESRAMDDAVAMAAYKGQMALYGLETEIDIEQMKADLVKMGFELQRDLATMDAETRKEVARLTGDYNKAISQDNRDSQKEASIISAIGLALGAYAALSDVQAKTNISPGAGEVESFLDALNSYKYEYKDPAGSDEAGMFIGVLAQDLEKTPMGASFVKDTPRGKQVDYGHGLAAILASQANIHNRLRNLEEG